MSNLRKRFHMEALETRQMMAGDVAAYVQNGNLYINEAAGQYSGDNGVRVYQLSNGMIRVEGAEANDGTANKSLVNGAAHQDFMIPGGLFVNLGGGHDRLHLGFDGAASAPIFASMSINMAAQDPIIAQKSASLIVGPSTIFNGPDDDQVFGWGFHSRGAVTINTGDDLHHRQRRVADGRRRRSPVLRRSVRRSVLLARIEDARDYANRHRRRG
jgi:hypothetical protein